MNFVPVVSSDIKAVACNGNNLVIAFLSGGVYEYLGAAKEFEKLLNATSKGRYFHQFIKNQYKHNKLN